MKKIPYIFIIALFLFSCNENKSEKNDWITFYEKSNCLETPRYDETVKYCEKASNVSPYICYTSFGTSPLGRKLPLVIMDKNGNFTPEKVRESGNAVLLVEACIHPGESEGKDAGLMLMRDIAITKERSDLLDNLTILFIPIFNVDGHERFSKYNRINQNGPTEMGWRVTAQNYNLNRDFLKADAPEMQDWLRLFNKWLPDFFIDCHTTDGADYQYVISYGLEIHGNMTEALTKWQKENYLKPISAKMEESGFPLVPYVAFRNWHDPRSGLVSWVAPPFLSEGYTALRNRPGLLIETHMLKPYKPRVESTYEMIKYSAEILNKEAGNLMGLIREADNFTASPEFRTEKFPVSYSYTEECDTIDFLGYEYTAEPSNLTGGTWFRYTDIPKTFRIPYYNKQRVNFEVELPEAYIISPEWTEVIERIKVHGIKTNILKKDTKIQVHSYKFHDEQWQKTPYEGRFRLNANYLDVVEERLYPAGSVIIDMNQPAAKVVAYILEPEAQSSFFSWGFFNAIFEQKEYSESYVMEEMAREMLEKDADLLDEYKKKMEDTEFASKPREIINWFYSKTPYWDDRKNVYPVGKIYERKILANILK